MKINYEALFWIMFVVNIIGLCYLISLVKSVNNLVMKVGVLNDTVHVKHKTTNLLISDLDDELRDGLTDIEGKVNLIQSTIDELIEEDEEWTPEPDEEDPEPGDVVTRGELTIEIDEDPIHLITPNQFFFEQGHDKFELEYDSVGDNLYYYYGPEDCEKIFTIGNVTECIGDGLKYFGVNSKNDDYVYVRNNIFHADFMIRKVS